MNPKAFVALLVTVTALSFMIGLALTLDYLKGQRVIEFEKKVEQRTEELLKQSK